MNTWNDLSLSEKSEMMRVAIENGITTLPEIKEAYNEFAKGGYAPSRTIKDRITAYEGKAMTGAKDPVTGKWGKNNSFESEAARFYNVLPENIREQVLSNPELADNLYSYSYNVGAGNFKKRVVPALERYYAGEGSIKDIENSMWASNDAKFRGLQRRRAEEKEGVRNALLGEVIPSFSTEQELPAFMPSNPQAFFAPLESYQRPVVVEEPLVQAAMENPYSLEQLEREERAQGLRNLGLAMSIMRGGQEQSYSPLWSAVSMLSGNQMAKGGKIHIKPENRGKFTALKERTGHSATWFKQHGTPAQKKMATFALNAKKWKHGLGGNLFSGEDEPTQQMNNGLNLYRRTNNLGETEYIYQETPDSEEILLTPTNKRFSDDPTNWDYEDASGRKYSPRMTTTYNPGEIREDTRGPLERMVDNYFGELKYQVNNNVPISGKYTMPAIAAAPFLAWAGEAAYPYVSAALANPYVDAGLTSAFAGHGLNHAVNEGINGWGDAAMTALELAPLGGLARPMFNKAALAVENYRYPFGRPQVPEGYITVKPQVRTKIGDVEIDTPNMAYRQGNDIGRTYQKYKDIDASVAQRQIEDNLEQLLSLRDGKPYISREEALDKAIANDTYDPAIGIEVNGHPAVYQDTPMYSDGYLWYGAPRIDETLPPSSLQSGLLVTPKNDAFVIGSNKATPYKGTGSGIIKTKSGVTTVTDNGGRLIPADADNLGLELNDISAYTWEPGYGYRRVFTEETPIADWPVGRTTPQITVENAAGDAALGAADFSYKSQNGLDLLTKHLYERKIHGYPAYTTDAMQFDPVAGEFTPVKREWADDVVTGLPKYAQDAIMHDVVDRNIAEFMKGGLSAEEAVEYANAAKKQLGSVKVGKYSKRDYEKAGRGNFGGFYDPNRNFISVNDAGNPRRVYTHEGRHLLDNKIDDEILSPSDASVFGKDFDSDKTLSRMQRARQKQEMTLRDAYDSDFESIPNSKFAEGLEDYKNMNREAITTNLDSRTYAYENFADARSLDSGVRIEDLPTAEQNAFIDELTDEQIFEAVEGANGYGRRYIAVLRDKGKLTPEKAQQFRESMKHVGAYAVPTTIAAGTLFGKQE